MRGSNDPAIVPCGGMSLMSNDGVPSEATVLLAAATKPKPCV
jgi:hypothetical protein